MALNRSFAILFILAASVLASPATSTTSQTGADTCSSSEFWYQLKNCCLPMGGPPLPPSPPHGKSCPADFWYWHKKKSCCVPKHPIPRESPPPQCSHHWEWNFATQCCEPGHATSTTHHHHPSQTPKHSQDDPTNTQSPVETSAAGSYYKKRHAVPLCPRSLDACPVSGFTGSEFECLDTTADLRSCGGCASVGEGRDCTTIEGAWNVGCEAGSCAVYTCALGYKLAADGTHCIKT